MATTTPNLGLRKPDGPDFVNVTTDISNNMQTIDNTFATSVPPAIDISGAGSSGSATRVARADHNHAGPGFGTPVAIGSVNQSGSSALVARADHVHALGAIASGRVVLDTWWPCDPSGSDYAYFYLPSIPSICKLSLFGNIGRSSGPIPAHSHTVSSLSANSGSTNIDHNHSVNTDTGTVSADHTHPITVNNGGSHSHSVTVSSGGSHGHSASSANHNHSFTRDGGATSPPWSVQMNSFGGTATSSFLGDTAVSVTVDAASDHSHSGSSGTQADHGHSASSGGISANHTHPISTSTSTNGGSHNHDISHSHSATSVGAGGYTDTYKYPQTVSILIDGVDRTSALGGPFGPSQAIWSNFDMNIQPYVATSGWHYLTYSNTTGGGRLRAYIYAEF